MYSSRFLIENQIAVREPELYCPICQRVIIASNIDEVQSGEHDGYVFVHDDVEHSMDEMKALSCGIN